MNDLAMTAEQTADVLGMSVAWVYRNQHLIPGYYTIGKSIFFNRHTLENHMTGFVPTPTKNPPVNQRAIMTPL